MNKLQPKTYFFKQEAYPALGLPKQKQYGFLAQELEQVLPDLVNTSEMPVRNSSTGERVMEEVKAVNYTALIPIIVKGMQEQAKRMQELSEKDKEIDVLKEENKSIKSELIELRKMVRELKTGRDNDLTSTGSINQNTPNPVKGSTHISYNLPQGVGKGQLLLTDALSRTIKVVNLNTSGTLNLNTTNLNSSTYYYSLVGDGKTLQTRKLTIVR